MLKSFLLTIGVDFLKRRLQLILEQNTAFYRPVLFVTDIFRRASSVVGRGYGPLRVSFWGEAYVFPAADLHFLV